MLHKHVYFNKLKKKKCNNEYFDLFNDEIISRRDRNKKKPGQS